MSFLFAEPDKTLIVFGAIVLLATIPVSPLLT
jgi:hypothetical protein